MSLDNVKQEIITQAEQEKQKIIDLANKEAESIKSNAKQEVSEYKKEASQKSIEFLEKAERKMLAAARFDAQREILNSKKKVIEEVLEKVKEHISAMKSADKKKFLQSLVKKAEAEIAVKTIYVSKEDAKHIPKKYTTKTDNTLGGIIAEDKTASVSVNLTVDELLQAAQTESLVELSGVLF